MRAFRLTVDQAELFFTICQELNATTEEQRTQILNAMAEYGEVASIVDTKMSKDEYVQHMAKQFGNVLRVSSKEDLQGDINDKSNASIGFNPNTFYSGGSTPGKPERPGE